MSSLLAFGVDPKPMHANFANFQACLLRHREFLDQLPSAQILKLQLAFFLAHGSKGISLLEEFVTLYKDKHTIILDGKFNDISTTLAAYLQFVFQHLGVAAITINPFLGEQTLAATFVQCAKFAGSKGRVYVLCATSEVSHDHLSGLQAEWKTLLNVCVSLRAQLFAGDAALQKLPGVVVAANREKILHAPELQASELSVLSPGLGAQGANWQVVQACAAYTNEVVFPLSRGIFGGGENTLQVMHDNFTNVQKHFREVHR